MKTLSNNQNTPRSPPATKPRNHPHPAGAGINSSISHSANKTAAAFKVIAEAMRAHRGPCVKYRKFLFFAMMRLLRTKLPIAASKDTGIANITNKEACRKIAMSAHIAAKLTSVHVSTRLLSCLIALTSCKIEHSCPPSIRAEFYDIVNPCRGRCPGRPV